MELAIDSEWLIAYEVEFDYFDTWGIDPNITISVELNDGTMISYTFTLEITIVQPRY